MITASEAKEISGPSSEDYLLFIEGKIKAAAGNRRSSVTIRDEPYARWLYCEKDCKPNVKATLKALRDSGFTLDFLYKESQFVDMGLIIKW